MVQFHIYQIGTYQKNMTNAQRQHLLSLLCVSRREKVEKIKIDRKNIKSLRAEIADCGIWRLKRKKNRMIKNKGINKHIWD